MTRRLVGLLLLPAATGCVAMRSDVVNLERQLAEQRTATARADSAMAASVSSLGRLLQAVADSVAAQQFALARLRGDLQVDLTSVQQQLVAIQELTGQSQQRLSELRGALAERSATQAPAPAAGPAGAAVPGPAAPAEPDADQLFDLALQQLRRGSPGTARTGFAEFLRRFPDHARAADAVFFTGEAWGADQRADSAAVAYRTVVQRWPRSPRAASATYRLGLQALAGGRSAEARDAFTRVVTQYPTAEEAALARERLRTLPPR
jgi:tol-pal system protein YbgF